MRACEHVEPPLEATDRIAVLYDIGTSCNNGTKKRHTHSG